MNTEFKARLIGVLRSGIYKQNKIGYGSGSIIPLRNKKNEFSLRGVITDLIRPEWASVNQYIYSDYDNHYWFLADDVCKTIGLKYLDNSNFQREGNKVFNVLLEIEASGLNFADIADFLEEIHEPTD